MNVSARNIWLGGAAAVSLFVIAGAATGQTSRGEFGGLVHLRHEPAAGDIAVEIGILASGHELERELALGRGNVVEFVHAGDPGDCCC